MADRYGSFLNTPLGSAFSNTALLDGTSSVPSLAYANETTLGFYRSAAGNITIAGGSLNVTTQAPGNNSTKAASTAYVDAAAGLPPFILQSQGII